MWLLVREPFANELLELHRHAEKRSVFCFSCYSREPSNTKERKGLSFLLFVRGPSANYKRHAGGNVFYCCFLFVVRKRRDRKGLSFGVSVRRPLANQVREPQKTRVAQDLGGLSLGGWSNLVREPSTHTFTQCPHVFYVSRTPH